MIVLKNEYDNLKDDYIKIFMKYFDEFNFENKNFDWVFVLSWRTSDWFNFIPYLITFYNLKYVNVYKCMLAKLIESGLFHFEHEYLFMYNCFKLWIEADHQSVVNNLQVVDFGPFHHHIFNTSLFHQLKPICLFCFAKCKCQLFNNCCGQCDNNFRCNLHTGLHLCSNHYKVIFDPVYSLIGFGRMFILNDGRKLLNLKQLKNIDRYNHIVQYYKQSISHNTYTIDVSGSHLMFNDVYSIFEPMETQIIQQ